MVSHFKNFVLEALSAIANLASASRFIADINFATQYLQHVIIYIFPTQEVAPRITGSCMI